ncbi:MAG: glycosyltransferase family 39 protein [Candidatus Shapirobacteria bacterium]
MKLLNIISPKNNNHRSIFFLFFLFIIGLLLRTYGLNWDQNYHLHPDERMITMVTTDISVPQSSRLLDIFSPDSTLNPKFFAYGSLPIYLLKFSGYIFSHLDPLFSSYDKINLLGRLISAIFDSSTIILVFLITKQLFFSDKKALFASLFYTLSVLPIQLSHFYAVDTLLTFFICFTLYRIILFYRHPSLKNAILIGISFGLSLATKISATVLIVAFGISLFIEALLVLKREIFVQKINTFKKTKIYLSSILNPKFWIKNKVFKLQKITLYFISTIIISFVTFIFFEPFALFDFPTFWKQINEQSVMTRNAFIFPYTLQYVGSVPYIFHLKNILLWGLGVPFAFTAFIGIIVTFKKLFIGLTTPGNESSEGSQLIVFSFFIVYFLVVGRFDVKFMRYCLPLYPILSIFASSIIFSCSKIVKVSIIFLNLIWVISFLNIYNHPNTRVLATQWMIKNITAGSTVLREHWDDGLPLGYDHKFNLSELTLYDSDLDPQKWTKINHQLGYADYLVIASNRLYTPLQKLTNCQKLPPDKCYTITAQYYQDLFSGQLGYTQVAEFTSYPSLFGVTINDQSADESFTVYDHPKVIIFRNDNLKK